jgi:hypothetical protein
MAKAGILMVGTGDGVVQYSEPGAMGRWIRVGHALRGALIRSLWLWADQPLVGLASAGDALVRTQDGGGVWERVAGAPPGVLAGGRTAQASVVCATAGGEIWRSEDAGVAWERVALLPVEGTALAHLVGAPSDAMRLYAAAGAVVWRSNDGGRGWAEVARLGGVVDGLAALPDGGACAASAGEVVLLGERGRALAPDLGVSGPLLVLPGREPTLLAAVPGGVLRAQLADGLASGEVAGEELPWPAGPVALLAAPYHMDTACAGGGSAAAISTDRGRTWLPMKGELSDVRSLAIARLI